MCRTFSILTPENETAELVLGQLGGDAALRVTQGTRKSLGIPGNACPVHSAFLHPASLDFGTTGYPGDLQVPGFPR